MLQHEHYSQTITGLRNEIDVFVSKEDGIQMGTSNDDGGVMVNLNIHHTRQLINCLQEMIRIQLIFEEG